MIVNVLLIIIAVLVLLGLILAAASVRVLREYERAVVFRLGRLLDQKGPGVVLLIPFIDRMVRVSLRTVTQQISPQDVITRDNVPARVTAVTYFHVVDANKSVVDVENVLSATSQIAQTTLRSVLGKADLDTLLAERERLNEDLQKIIDDQTEPWGIKVTAVEIKDVEIPEDMRHAIARQAEAERERRAKIINAEGEAQAAAKLGEAAEVISQNPVTIQLRYLQTLLEIGDEPEHDDRLPAADRPDRAADADRQELARRPGAVLGARAAGPARAGAGADRRRLRAAQESDGGVRTPAPRISARTSASETGAKSTYQSPTPPRSGGVCAQITSSASLPSIAAACAEPTGAATITRPAPRRRTARTAARADRPVARPSSTRITVRPRTSIGSQPSRYSSTLRSSSRCSRRTTSSICSWRRRRRSQTSRSRTTVPSSQTAPTPNSGLWGAPSLRTVRRSICAPSARAISTATGTPPRGSARITGARPARGCRSGASSRPA